jgi:chromosomal replication initiation ATPase DnaA
MNEDYILAYKIINDVCGLFKVDPKEVKTTTRKAKFLFYRLICAHEIRKHTGLNLTNIAHIFSGSNHCMTIYYQNLYEDLLFSTPVFKEMVAEYNNSKLGNFN